MPFQISRNRQHNMPTVTMRFTLPEEQHEFDAARLGHDAVSALWHIAERCRGTLKHCEPGPELEAFIGEIRELIPDECLEV